MIYITGDTHIPIDVHKLFKKNWKEQEKLSKQDYLIICGDFGGVWNNSKEEKYWLNWLNEKPFTTLFIDGNHENFNILNNYYIDQWNGGKIHKIQESIFHLMRGQVYKIDDLKIFTMGGACSFDKEHRIMGKSWWNEEEPSVSEWIEACTNLDLNDNKVDVVVSHCAPLNILSKISNIEYNIYDSVSKGLYSIELLLDYKKWYFGHYHIDKKIDDQFECMYNRIIRIK